MGEQKVELIEQNIKHNMDDIREVKKRLNIVENNVTDLKSNLQVTNQTMSHIMSTLEELKSDFKATNGKMESGFNSINKKVDENQIEQLKEYKSGVLKIGIIVIGGILTALILYFIGIS